MTTTDVRMFVICPNCDGEMEQVGEDQDWMCESEDCGAWMSDIAGQHQWQSRVSADQTKLEAWKAMASA